MEYNGYHAVVTFDDDVGILHGEVIDTRDVITFQGKSVDELRQAFRDSVEEYLKICAERNREAGQALLRPRGAAHGTRNPQSRGDSSQDRRNKPELLDRGGNEGRTGLRRRRP